MTREEAIDRLIEARAGHKEFLSIETLNMAIKALQQEPCTDAISRQAAIDAFEKFIHELGIEDEPYNYGEMALSVKNVPPIMPQPRMEHCMDFTQHKEAHDDEGIATKNIAKAFQLGVAFGFGEKYDEMNKVMEEVKKAITPDQQPCDDCISRWAVLKQTYKWSKDEFLRDTNPFDYLRKKILSLPSVTPQPKIGHWTNNQNGTFECDQCGYKHSKSRFCPDCGTKME